MEPLVFRRWSNKKWAAFSSLHRVIIIATLSFSYQMLAQDLRIEKPDSSQCRALIELEEVEAVGDLPAQIEGLTLRPVSVISSREIEAAPAGTYEDILELFPQLDIRQRGKHGTQADLSIQGGSFDQSLVLLNGIDLSDPQTGHFQLNLPVDLHASHQMEVITGAATRRFGTHAFSGAINLVTQPSDTSFFRGGIRYGQHNFYKANALINIGGRQLNSLFSAGTGGSSGYRDNTDFRKHHAFLHVHAEKEDIQLHLMSGMDRRAFGANAFYSPRFPRQYEETTTGMLAVKTIYQPGRIRWILNAYYRLNRDHFLLDRKDPDFYQNDHLNSLGGVELKAGLSWKAGITHTGLRWREEGIRSTSLGEKLDSPLGAWFNDSVRFTHGTGRKQLNWNLNHSWEKGPLAFSGGFLIYIDPLRPGDAGIYPGLDFRIRLSRNLAIYASANRSMRLPTFTDLYYQGPSNIGNSSLQAEHALTLEAGISHKEGSWQMGLNTFYRMGRQMIDWVLMEDDIWHTMNFSRIDALGGDLHAGYRPQVIKGAGLSLAYAGFSYSYTHLTRMEEIYESRYLLDQLKHKLVLSANIRAWESFYLSITLRAQDRNGSFMLYDAATGGTSEQAYDPFTLFDLKLGYRNGRFHLFLEGSNLFDTPYYDIGNVIQPGRWMMGGVELLL